jgi:hypothetical protein
MEQAERLTHINRNSENAAAAARIAPQVSQPRVVHALESLQRRDDTAATARQAAPFARAGGAGDALRANRGPAAVPGAERAYSAAASPRDRPYGQRASRAAKRRDL